ncbi:MAG: shikimate kinase [FCB group bacterium]|jgi:shikimate kinase|nr:shikimate kinase [FCB group bacterium]
MNIVLIGYRGTGKSSVARLLADQTGRTAVDMDDEIVQALGMPIPDFVEKEGWDRFRDVESEVCWDLSAQDNLVIATGGGVVTRPENIAALKAKGRLFWLRARPKTIVGRIRDDSNRPSLTGTKSFLEEIEHVLEARTPLYRAAAEFDIDTDDRPLQNVADDIMRRMLDS